MSTGIDSQPRDPVERHQRWERMRRAELLKEYRDLQAHGLSQRQVAKQLEVSRTTLQAWRTWQDQLDTCPLWSSSLKACPGSLSSIAWCWHSMSCVEIGACGIRLVCLLLHMTGLNQFAGASYGTPQRINRRVEEATVAYRREETARLARDMTPQDITVTQDETFTGGLCLVAIEPVSNSILLEEPAEARDHDTWSELMAHALAPLKCSVIQSTSDEAPVPADAL